MDFHKALKDAGLLPTSKISSALFKDFHNLQGVWTHPKMLDLKKVKSDSVDDESETDDESTTDEDSNGSDSDDNLMPGTSELNAKTNFIS